MKINSYKDLIVWQKSYLLVKMVYVVTSKLPKSETFVLKDQMNRCALSIVSNIAEGTGRKTRKDYSQFLHISLGSLAELETQLLLCADLHGMSVKNELELTIEIGKMLNSLISKLET